MRVRRLRLATLLLGVLLIAGCASAPRVSPVPLAPEVDLARYMGDWYLIAHIPTFRDREAYNAVENYALNADGTVAITYENRQGGFEGPRKRMTPMAYVEPGSGNALWGVRFVWLQKFVLRGEYRIAHLEPDYSVVIVARSKLDYVWLFSRRAEMSEAELARYTAIMAAWGYDTTKLLRVPQLR